MAYTPISNSQIQVGKATKKEIFQTIADNFNDHEQRILALSLGAAPVVVFNNDVLNASSANSFTGLAYYRAVNAFTVTTVKIQIFEKGIVTSGLLKMDIKKGTSLDPITFNSILTTEAEIDFSTASDYDDNDGIINPLNQSVAAGEFLRLDITSLPSIPVGKFRVFVYGVL